MLAEQEELRRTASEAADQTEQQLLNQYRAGQVGYTDVVTRAGDRAECAPRAGAVAATGRRAVALIQALGGGWRAPARVDGEAPAARGDAGAGVAPAMPASQYRNDP